METFYIWNLLVYLRKLGKTIDIENFGLFLVSNRRGILDGDRHIGLHKMGVFFIIKFVISDTLIQLIQFIFLTHCTGVNSGSFFIFENNQMSLNILICSALKFSYTFISWSLLSEWISIKDKSLYLVINHEIQIICYILCWFDYRCSVLSRSITINLWLWTIIWILSDSSQLIQYS